MKKSTMVLLGSLALAASFIGCEEEKRQQDVRACTDRDGNIVDDSKCIAQPQTANGYNPNTDNHLLRDILIYHWVFGGNYNRNRYMGGGGYMPHSNTIIYVPARSQQGTTILSYGGASRAPSSVTTTTVRGGFGSSFSGAHGSASGGGGE